MAGVRQFDESRLLHTSLDLFWRNGFEATTMKDIAEASGVQRGSLYNSYGDKDSIFILSFNVYSNNLIKSTRECLTGSDIPGSLEKYFLLLINNMTIGSPARGCLTTKTAADGSIEKSQIRDELKSLLDSLNQLLENFFQENNISKYTSASPSDAARVVITFTRGLAIMERVYGDKEMLIRTAKIFLNSFLKH
ncbi:MULTISPECIES: TetR/AcrR family transcriptional regulator [Comamonas]|jgi:AcrR family transcriptional regulator|uniref:TetR/AcrR family transcriptional regulator n=1 Tax=Comamonas TaxID=283 RepID=UPI0009B8058E|nr:MULTISPECIES: TetR/AcrR family transcriptional regulator [Comamonas]MPT09130.1 TetR/AcrR family transcriptional regulator [Comamonas sp.]